MRHQRSTWQVSWNSSWLWAKLLPSSGSPFSLRLFPAVPVGPYVQTAAGSPTVLCVLVFMGHTGLPKKPTPVLMSPSVQGNLKSTCGNVSLQLGRAAELFNTHTWSWRIFLSGPRSRTPKGGAASCGLIQSTAQPVLGAQNWSQCHVSACEDCRNNAPVQVQGPVP